MTWVSRRALGRWALNAAAGLAFGFILLPLVFVVWLAFFRQAIPSFPPQGYSFKWFLAIADSPRFVEGFWLSLVTQGSTELVHALLANDLVDAMSIFTVPVVLGGGKRLFADGSAPHSFRLTRSRVSPNGLIVGHYEREGEIKVDTALDSPSEREIGRRKRMKREG